MGGRTGAERPEGPQRVEKTCARCGRTMVWRKRWAKVWDEVRYCGDACRRGPRGAGRDVATRLREAILELLARRPASATICPSEAARAVDPERWRDLMTATRDEGRRLAAEGRIAVTQRGVVVDAATAKGPIRYRAAAGLTGAAGARQDPTTGVGAAARGASGERS
jgi:hypothetical protein